MISIERAVKQANIRNFTARNGGNGRFMGHAKSQTAVGNHEVEVERSWAMAKGGSNGDINTQLGTYLASKGYTTGSLRERLQAFMKNGTQA